MISADAEAVNSCVLPFVREPLCSTPTLTRTVMTTTMIMTMITTMAITITQPTSVVSVSRRS